jgi:cytochrome c5
MKQMISVLMITAMVFALTSVSYAASSRRGKQVFAKVCGSCHVKGSEADRLKPSKKTMAQWKRFIDKNQHDADKHVLDDMADKDRKNLEKFLIDYAADADTVETCG